jgi:hypothetical protein
MSTDAPSNRDTFDIPESAAEAWAEVYIDVAEKLDAEQQQADAVAGPAKKCDTESSKSLHEGDTPCPST